MSGDDVGSSEQPDAQQNMPASAGTARPAGDGEKPYAEITWVGAQHLMHGYCGRVVVGRRDVGTFTARPLHRPRARPLRIGPRPVAAIAAAPARAA